MVHTQIEEVHERVGVIDRRISESVAQRDAAASRIAHLGVVVSSCLASIRVATSRVDKLDSMSDELQALSMQGAEIVRALHAREGSRSHDTDENTSNSDKSGPQREPRHPSDQSRSSEFLEDLPKVASYVSIQRSVGLPGVPTGQASMPTGLPVRSFFRRSRDGHYERDTQTAIIVPKNADLLITTTPLGLHALLTAQAQSLPSTTRAGNVDDIEVVVGLASSSSPLIQETAPPPPNSSPATWQRLEGISWLRRRRRKM